MGLWESITAPVRNTNLGAISGGIAAGPLGFLAGGMADTQAGITRALTGDPTPEYSGIAPGKQLVNTLNKEEKRAQQSPEEYQKKLMAGVNEAGSVVGFDPMSGALSSRAQRAFQKSGGDLARQAQTQSVLNRLNQTQRVYDARTALENYKRGVDYRYQSAQIQEEQTRSQVLGSLFGGIGQLGGSIAAYANRPTYAPVTSSVPSLAMPTPAATPSATYGLGGNYNFGGSGL